MRVFKMVVNNFPKQLKMVIGLYSFGSLIFLKRHYYAIQPGVWQDTSIENDIKMFLYIEMNRVSVFFMFSFKILSKSGLLLFLRDLMAFLISAFVLFRS